jgi:hypothetical protein
MIKYLLKCNDCDQEFESWFGSSEEYDKLRKLKLLNCQYCDSLDVKKSLMSPNLFNTKKKENLKDIKKLKDIRKKLSDYKKFVKDNFEYVGENFAYKARSIHYDKKKPKKGIYGSASVKEVKELRDEGIETDIVPWIDDDKN